MSDIHRPKTLESLEMKGVYVNDYPGLILDGKDISYFFTRFTREDIFGSGGEGREGAERASDSFLSGIQKFIERRNEETQTAGTDGEIKIFYLDDQGHCIMGLVEKNKEPLRFPTKRRDVEAARLFQVNLFRVFQGEGIDGLYQMRQGEVKGVYDGLQKYIAAYLHGWLGLFRQYETIGERTDVFRKFKPFKLPIFGTRETLKNCVFHIQLGARTPDGDEGFKRISSGYGSMRLEDALAV